MLMIQHRRTLVINTLSKKFSIIFGFSKYMTNWNQPLYKGGEENIKKTLLGNNLLMILKVLSIQSPRLHI